MKALWIVGGAGAALEAWAVHAALQPSRPDLRLAGFITLEPQPEFDPAGLAVVLEPEFLASFDAAAHHVVLALGSPRARLRAARAYSDRGFSFASLIHPSAVIGPRVQLGQGAIVMAAAVLETDVRIGDHALINVQCSVAHECRIGDACSLGPGVHLAGRVTVGDACDIGVGAVLRPRVTLGSHIVVGAGAVVVKDQASPATLVGVPARPIEAAPPARP